MFHSLKQRMQSRSTALLSVLETRLDRIMLGWLVFAALASATRVGVTPIEGPVDVAEVLPYALLIFAPIVSMLLARRWFADADSFQQPALRLARAGRWTSLPLAEAKQRRLYGAGGIMVSLLVGTLLNVPVRALEYLAAMPVLSGAVPEWLSTLHFMMTLDVVLLSSLYAIAFVAALRRVPLFPRLLAAIWAVDLLMQMAIALTVSHAGGLPLPVADALHTLLDGNVKKVLISVGLWLPYLLLSKRVNLTYRNRIPA
jgi:hypothetical protein